MTPGQQVLQPAQATTLLSSLAGQKTGGFEIADVRFPAATQWKAADAQRAVFRNVEWLGAVIGGRLLGRGRIQDCRFERVNVDSVRCRKVDFVDCHFESVTFGEHYFGSIGECGFLRCTFVRCRFDAVGFVKSELHACKFEGIKAERASWKECLLEDVMLTGTLVKTNFISSAFRRVDLSAAILHDSSLVYAKEGDAKLPDRPDNFAIDPRLFLDAEPLLLSKLEPSAHERYRELAKGWSMFGSPFIVDATGVLEELPPRDRGVVMATLYEIRQGRPLEGHGRGS